MRRRGPVMNVIMFIVGAGFLMAILGLFNGDIFMAFTWLVSFLWGFVEQFRDWFLGMAGFREFFSH